MDIKNLKRDTSSIEGGMWVGNLPDMGSMRLKVRGLSSNAYTRSLDKRRRTLESSAFDSDGNVLDEVWEGIVAEALLESVLLDWAGLEDDGKPVAYDRALARVWLTEPDYRDFRKAVVVAAGRVDRERAKTAEATRKN